MIYARKFSGNVWKSKLEIKFKTETEKSFVQISINAIIWNGMVNNHFIKFPLNVTL